MVFGPSKEIGASASCPTHGFLAKQQKKTAGCPECRGNDIKLSSESVEGPPKKKVRTNPTREASSKRTTLDGGVYFSPKSNALSDWKVGVIVNRRKQLSAE
jgi:hypothetical protein